MRSLPTVALAAVIAVLCVTASVGAQKDGDLIVGQFRDSALAGSYGPGSMMAIDINNGNVVTFAPRLALIKTTAGTISVGPNWVEMASDNTNMIVAGIPGQLNNPTLLGNTPFLFEVDQVGTIVSTLVNDATPPSTTGNYLNTCELDYNGNWILAGGTSLWRYNENTTTYQTLWTQTTPAGTHNAMTIDYGFAASPYIVGKFNVGTSTAPKLVAADASGIVSTIAGGAGPSYISGVKVDYSVGDYISSGFGTNAAGAGGEYMRTDKVGQLTSLNVVTSMYRANGIYIDKMRTAYILTYDWQTQPVPTIVNNYVCAIYKMDLQGTFISMYYYDPAKSITRGVFAPAGITQYGSRHVCCIKGNGAPGTVIDINVSSRNPLHAKKTFQLAAATSYSSGLQLATGEYLDLNPGDPLFLPSALNLLPAIFSGFSGTLDAFGDAKAKVNIPASLPPGLNLPIFISGVLVDPAAPGGIARVFNTHWFVLT